MGLFPMISPLMMPKSVQANEPESREPDTWIRDQFREYCTKAKAKHGPFTKEEETTVRLLSLLKDKNAPMNAYEPTMLWHLHMSNQLYPHQQLGDYAGYIGRNAMLKRLLERYNYGMKQPKQKTVKLPVSGTIVKLTCHDAKATIQRLLTDPRIKAKDYLFWDGNPLSPPPETIEVIEDLNTGMAYLQTHAQLINPEGREQLMPVVIYFDGTAVSHFHDMEIIQVNIALGTMTRLARTNSYCWAPLGYIEKIHEHGGRGRQILAQANHMESQDMPGHGSSTDSSASSTEKVRISQGVGDKTDQDFHAMMSVMLEELVDLQESGFLWDHCNPVTGEVTRDIHYKIFVPFLKVDGKEGDLACAKYGQRSSTQQICRKCHIPLGQADNHMANYALKTVEEIKALIDSEDLDGLRALSQTYLRNAFYKVRFSMGNNRGVHGSCPSELLHAFLLGTFKYLRDIFFEMMGKTSERAKLMNALSKVCAQLFTRQSDRTMPGTAFSKGIMAGKLMAKDYRGVLLVMLAMIRSQKGREILKTAKEFKGEDEAALNDWILLVELMLEWESYLNEPKMYVKHVKRLEKKHRYIMYVMRKVARRTAGKGLKLLKFHTILHIWEDILELGVPLEYDTSANESMHKPSKKASKMTQRAADTFNLQTATRLLEFELIDLAMTELELQLVPWEYYDQREDAETGAETPDNDRISTGEARIKVHMDEDTNEPAFWMASRSKFAAKTKWNAQVIDFLLALQDKIRAADGPDSLDIYTCHRRKGQVFRGHPNFRGKGPWKDWVWVNWGAGFGKLPAHIWCFVNMEDVGRGAIDHGGVRLKKGVFAVVETATLSDNNHLNVRCDLFTPIYKEVQMEGNVVQNRTFYLADAEAFDEPCCVIPDLGGPPNRYFVVKPRNQWAKEFIRWLEEPHNLDAMDDLDPHEDSGEDEDEKEESNSEESGEEEVEDEAPADENHSKRRRK